MPHSELRKTSSFDAVVFCKRPLDIVCLTVSNGTRATLEKQEANSGEVSSQHLVGFFKDGCTNLLWIRAAATATLPPRRLSQRHVPLGDEAPTVGRQADGGRMRPSISDSDLEAFSHNPAHAHVPYWWVNNPTIGEFCFTVIGRADIEGSKSNVAMNAWLPQASYPYDVPPQPNSPPENVFRSDRPAERALGPKRGAVPRLRFTE
ncbi:hypothetical protein CQW23_32700 [Capsicum baccatum]|uniref:Uncharacterized protein n=1 Tax=Capsicum baccatum TaxID=33114 RepID=A0A2G2V444_CAPBA|nr:hypothetical protein CQW23_32700 [Capsicum baccatum]